MKLVIDLSKEDLRIICERAEKEIWEEYGGVDQRLMEAVQNGTSLPKGHGELKDTQDIINRLNLNYNNHQTISVQSIKDIIQTIPTIIEADKGE